MRCSGRIALRLAATLLCTWVLSCVLLANDAPRTDSAPTPEQDDATLHDVTCVGTQLAWAVGERGSIWKTGDGGRTWQFSPAPVECALQSVCFLTDKIGWAVGGGIAPYTRRD